MKIVFVFFAALVHFQLLAYKNKDLYGCWKINTYNDGEFHYVKTDFMPSTFGFYLDDSHLVVKEVLYEKYLGTF